MLSFGWQYNILAIYLHIIQCFVHLHRYISYGKKFYCLH